jgi:hypothetical protein
MITDSNQACLAKMTGRRLQEEVAAPFGVVCNIRLSFSKLRLVADQHACFHSGLSDMFWVGIRNTYFWAEEVYSCLFIAVPQMGCVPILTTYPKGRPPSHPHPLLPGKRGRVRGYHHRQSAITKVIKKTKIRFM